MSTSIPSDLELEEYLVLSAKIKFLEQRVSEIKEACKTIGSFSTDKYVCAVTDQERRGIAGLSEVEKALGKDLLYQHGLIRLTVFQVVRISEIVNRR
jgi:hypothetical protein